MVGRVALMVGVGRIVASGARLLARGGTAVQVGREAPVDRTGLVKGEGKGCSLGEACDQDEDMDWASY